MHSADKKARHLVRAFLLLDKRLVEQGVQFFPVFRHQWIAAHGGQNIQVGFSGFPKIQVATQDRKQHFQRFLLTSGLTVLNSQILLELRIVWF